MIVDNDTNRALPRISLIGFSDLQDIIGVQVAWPGGESVPVLDLSFSGSAMRRPKSLEFEKGRRLRLNWSFAGNKTLEIESELIRFDEKMVAIKFVKLEAKALEVLDSFLTENLIGRNLSFVNPKFYGSRDDYQFWFHGPKDTNLFVWADGDRAIRTILEFDRHILNYAKGDWSLKKLPPTSSLEEDTRWQNIELTKVFLSRAIRLLTQIVTPPPAIWDFLEHLKEKAK